MPAWALEVGTRALDGAGVCSQGPACEDPSVAGDGWVPAQGGPFPQGLSLPALSGTDVSSGGENHASRLRLKLPPGGGRTPGAHFNFPKALLFYCSYLGFYYYCC